MGSKTIDTDVVIGTQAVIPASVDDAASVTTDGNKTMSTAMLKTGDAITNSTTTVNFKVKYDKNYAGQKFMAEGSIQPVAPDVAALFEDQGMGKVVKD